ncbi:hypothetical protein [Microbulbifer elongatus]|uniref:Vgb family protein n=1 Tax=Microbulbifer elongatus TaxID=86173 RepID=UPI001CFD852F|nr:hypothetical protein [Microbulbifer elongatus]
MGFGRSFVRGLGKALSRGSGEGGEGGEGGDGRGRASLVFWGALVCLFGALAMLSESATSADADPATPSTSSLSTPSFQVDSQFTWHPRYAAIKGVVIGNGAALAGFRVSLYASFPGNGGYRKLASTVSNASGDFKLPYHFPHALPRKLAPVLFVIAEKGSVMLAAAVEGAEIPEYLVLNERTTVALGNAFAQFIRRKEITGNPVGMRNAVKMAANMADLKNGNVGDVLLHIPNGPDTSTLPTFNALSNVVAACVAQDANCKTLFEITTPQGAPPVTNVLEALANIAKNPTFTNYEMTEVDPLFELALVVPLFQPALTEQPSNWLLFIKFTGGRYSRQDRFNLMNGPGNLAFDAKGNAWINDNYVPRAPDEFACAGQRLMKFHPWGEQFAESPFFYGGLSGAGFGITLDPRGNVWVGNFGFEAPSCADGTVPPDPANKIPATHNSVSLFLPSGVPVSGKNGFTRGRISWPQATVSDRRGNIWVANCGNDSVTVIRGGNPLLAQNVRLPGSKAIYRDGESPLLKPFAIAIDNRGRAWVTGNKAQKLYRLDLLGNASEVAINGAELRWPMGISSDSKGNLWISNSDSVNIPCIDPLDPQDGGSPSVVFVPAGGGMAKTVTLGGLTIPWGNAVDGDDSLWVFNFGNTPTKDVDESTTWPDTGVAHICGSGDCPAGKQLGDPISPMSGYTSDALDRVTGGGVDPSGNLWLVNNWKKAGPYLYDINPGGNSFVIVPGAAKPVKTPLLGAPRDFAE